jgi:hypothetical protein
MTQPANTLVFPPSRSARGRLAFLPLEFRKNTPIKKKIKFSSYEKIQSGAVANSYMTDDLLIYGKIFAHYLIY